MTEVVDLPLSQVSADPNQHRTHFPSEYLAGLAESIRANGQLDPVKVIRHGDGWQIVDGECRLRACRLAKLDTIRAVVLEVDEGQRLAIQATANLARADVRPCEEARAFAKIIAYDLSRGVGLTEEEARRRCAKVTGKSLQRVGYKLRLLALPQEVQYLVDKGALGEGQALALGRLAEAGHEAETVRQARKAVAEGSGVQEVRARVAAYLGAEAQGDLFGGAAQKRSEEGKAAAEGVARIIGHLECVAGLSFDEKGQKTAIDAGALTAAEVKVAVAKLRGGLKHLSSVIDTLEGKGKPADDTLDADDRAYIDQECAKLRKRLTDRRKAAKAEWARHIAEKGAKAG